MTRATFTVAVAILCSGARAEQPPVTIVSPCECRDAHGKGQWAVKNDTSLPPTGPSAIQAVRLSDVDAWPWIGIELNWQSERAERENNWVLSDWPRSCNPQSEIYNLKSLTGS
jgi:hypothetical protein